MEIASISLQTGSEEPLHLLHFKGDTVRFWFELHTGRRQRVRRCLLPAAKAESAWQKKKNLLFIAEPKRPEGLVGPSGGGSGSGLEVAALLLLDMGAHKAHVCRGSRTSSPPPLHDRLEEGFSVYSWNKK